MPTDDSGVELKDSDSATMSPSVAPPCPIFSIDDTLAPASFQATYPLDRAQIPAAHAAAVLAQGLDVESSELPVIEDQSFIAERPLSEASLYEQRTTASNASPSIDTSQSHGTSSPQHVLSWSLTRSPREAHQSPTRPLNPLPDLGIERQLLDYFVGHLSDTLMPVALPAIPNYLNVFLLPMALEGSRLGRSNVSAASSIFHLINSLSAFQLSSTVKNRQQRESWSKIALKHYNLALSILQKVILLDDPKEYIAMLGALLMCLIKETMTINQPTWQVHIVGACHWVRRIDPNFWTESLAGSYLYQFFAITVTLAKTQLVTDDQDDQDMAQAMFNFDHPSELYLVDQFMGIQEAITKAVNTINDIRHPPSLPSDPSTSTVQTPDSAHPRPDTSPSFLDFFETELFMTVPQPRNRIDLVNMIDDPSTVIYYHHCIHYYACLIYFKRIVRNIPVADVQNYVRQSFDHLELITKYTSRPTTPAVWPLACTIFEIADSTLQDRACRMLDSFTDNTHFEFWATLKKVARALWTARVDGTADCDEQWPGFLKNLPGKRVFLF